RPLAAVTQRLVQVAARDLERGHEPEDERGGDRDREREDEHGGVQADHGLRGDDARRDDRDQALEAAPGQEGAPRGPPERQEQALDEELTHDAASARPIAARIANSFSRTVARARSRLATLPQPISRSSPTAASTMNSVDRKRPTTESARDW